MFFKKAPAPEPTHGFFDFVCTGIFAIGSFWILGKLVSFVRSVSDPRKKWSYDLYVDLHHQKDVCHCKLWHPNCNDSEVKVGWHSNDQIRFAQNLEISEAFIAIEKAVKQLSQAGAPRAVSTEEILQMSIHSQNIHMMLSETELVRIAVEQENLLVATSLKNAWPLLPPTTTQNRRYVELFCQNLEEQKVIYQTLAEEQHSLLEHLQYVLNTFTTYSTLTVALMKIFERYSPQMAKKDALQLQSTLKLVQNFMKQNNCDMGNVKEKLTKSLHTLNKEGLRRIIALDTEMVGAGSKGQINMLARVSLVNKSGCIYDKYVRPSQPVTDYRTAYSGIRSEDVVNAVPFDIVQREVRSLINGCILVGHDVERDLDVLYLQHPAADIRDTAFFKHFRRVPNEKPSLKYLAQLVLQRTIQDGEHDSVEDARASLDLYLVMQAWDWHENTV